MASPPPKLFQPIQVGRIQLQHRVVLAPLTRLKCTEKTHIPYSDIVKEYYTQRASHPGTLLISEASLVARKAGLSGHIPGFYSSEQLEAWKQVAEGVHEKGSFIFGQLWALGRAADPKCLREEVPDEPLPYVSASDIGLKGKEQPRPLTLPEIKEYAALFAQAALDIVEKCGFDGVEISGCNGYLVHQFLEDGSNIRTDEYGGTIENRCRFALEIVDAVKNAVGPDRTALRLSPWNEFLEMRMEDPIPTYSHLVKNLPSLAYLHVVEPRVTGIYDRPPGAWSQTCSNDFIRDIWRNKGVLISAGGYGRESGIEVAEEKGDLIAYGRWFISNPDLPRRLKENIPLNMYDRKTFYVPGRRPEGYIDYPFAI